MAKKRSKPSPTSTSKGAGIEGRSEAALAKASKIVEVVNLESVFLEEFSAKRTPDATNPSEPIRIVFGLEEAEIGRDEADEKKRSNRFHVGLSFVLKGLRKHPEERASDSKEESPLIEIKAKFVLIYSIPSFEGIEDENLIAFGQTSGVFSAWPYWREHVHNTTLRLAVPPVVLPTYRI